MQQKGTILVYITLIGVFIFSILMSLDVECKRLYFHVHLMYFVVYSVIESIFYFFLRNRKISKPIILTLSLVRTIPLFTWQIVLMILAEPQLLSSCIHYAIWSSLFCVFFCCYSIRDLTITSLQ